MMDFEWPAGIRSSHRLFVFWGNPAEWSVAFKWGVRDFNAVMFTKGVNLHYEITDERRLANVIFATGGPHEVTHPLHGEFSQEGEILGNSVPPVVITLRTQPKVLARRRVPGKRDRQQFWRPPGDGLLSVVVAHELLHACGLESHCDLDVFAEELEPALDETRPPDDQMKVKSTGELMPPLVLSPATVKRLQKIWS